MSDYDFRPAGSLKLKGDTEGGLVKRKKKKSKSKPYDNTEQREKQRVKDLMFEDSAEGSSSSGPTDRRTEAEKRFEETQKKRLAERVAKLANKTHKDRVSEFNAHLESLSEHHDIPKVGPG